MEAGHTSAADIVGWIKKKYKLDVRKEYVWKIQGELRKSGHSAVIKQPSSVMKKQNAPQEKPSGEMTTGQMVLRAIEAGNDTAEDIQLWIKKNHKTDISRDSVYTAKSNMKKAGRLSAVIQKPSAVINKPSAVIAKSAGNTEGVNKSQLIRNALEAGQEAVEDIQSWIKKHHKHEVTKELIYNVLGNIRKKQEKAGASALVHKPSSVIAKPTSSASNSFDEIARVKDVIAEIGFEQTKKILGLLEEVRTLK